MSATIAPHTTPRAILGALGTSYPHRRVHHASRADIFVTSATLQIRLGIGVFSAVFSLQCHLPNSLSPIAGSSQSTAPVWEHLGPIGL